ncbi:hypothetical protein [Lactobacillus sp. M0390]|uniref:hypothetical protein n=1 Tax=Lactobacillus sp. M0390 TaxID=2751026 RepID=UPI0018DD8BF0|nr:hypothetical protein [Lactobacillus sp. M0390]MBH9985227.1 hypothetical protein [Lactobacillus sp. M0390]
MTLKQVNFRVDDKSEIYRWLKYQHNKSASIAAALTSAIEEYGYTDLVKTIIKQKASHDNTDRLLRTTDNTQDKEKNEKYKNFKIKNSYTI